MGKASDYEKKAEAMLLPIVAQHQFELVDVEFVKEAGNYFLRAYIDKPGGITIDDCETVSRAFSDELDKDDFIEEAYILEVSSPGLGRPLKKDKDFDRHKGDEVEIKLYKPFKTDGDSPLNGEKLITGILKEYDAKSIDIEIEKDYVCKIQRADIALIRLAFDF